MIIHPMTTSTTPSITTSVTTLNHLGVIHARGEDAAQFLHNQFTQDVLLMPAGHNTPSRLAAWCSPKGRMLASFTVFKRAKDDILLVCSRDLLAPTLQRLKMFVLRAKVQLSDATADFTVYGIVNGAALELAVQPVADAPPAGTPLPEGQWEWLSVRSGIATITAPIVDKYVPQMLNYESIGGVNFKKGCYPGQEVVARSQFRGTLKRRAFIIHSDTPLAVGAEILESASVVQSAANPEGGFDAIVCVQLADLEALQQQFTFIPLPYALVEDV